MGLGVDGRDAEHAAHPVGADADGGDGRRGLHPAVPPALDMRGVQEQVGEPTSPRSREASSATPATSDLHIALTWSFESLYAHLLGDPLHLPRRDAVGPRFRGGRRDGAVRPRLHLDQALREVRPRAQLGDARTMSPTGVASPRSR